jgi:aminoglycoside phosphotransferase (APT) family kinase protein
MPSNSTPEGFDFAARTREFATAMKDFVDRLSRGGPGLPATALTRQLLSVIDANAAITRIPIDHLRSVAKQVEQQRAQLAQMQEQLQTFDDQLKTLSDALHPMLEWEKQWTSAQETLLARFPDQGATDK